MGMNGGIHDALNLTSKLGAVIRRDADENLLADYDLQRRTVTMEAIQGGTIRNKKNLEAKDEADRARFRAEIRAAVADPEKGRQLLRRIAMLDSLDRAAALHATWCRALFVVFGSVSWALLIPSGRVKEGGTSPIHLRVQTSGPFRPSGNCGPVALVSSAGVSGGAACSLGDAEVAGTKHGANVLVLEHLAVAKDVIDVGFSRKTECVAQWIELRGHGALFVGSFGHSEVANGTILFAIYCAARTNIAAAVACAGLTFFINAFMGVWLILPLASVMAMLVRRGDIGVSQLLHLAILWEQLSALAFIVSVANATKEGHQSAKLGRNRAARRQLAVPQAFWHSNIGDRPRSRCQYRGLPRCSGSGMKNVHQYFPKAAFGR
jgi:FAD binding domain